MYQKDYILKLIEQAAKLIQQILTLNKDGKQKEALEIINISYQSVFGLTKDEIIEQTAAKITTKFQNNSKNSLQLLELLSDFLYQEALMSENKDIQIKLLKKSYDLIKYVDENDFENFSFIRKNKKESLFKFLSEENQ